MDLAWICLLNLSNLLCLLCLAHSRSQLLEFLYLVDPLNLADIGTIVVILTLIFLLHWKRPPNLTNLIITSLSSGLIWLLLISSIFITSISLNRLLKLVLLVTRIALLTAYANNGLRSVTRLPYHSRCAASLPPTRPADILIRSSEFLQPSARRSNWLRLQVRLLLSLLGGCHHHLLIRRQSTPAALQSKSHELLRLSETLRTPILRRSARLIPLLILGSLVALRSTATTALRGRRGGGACLVRL